MTKQEFAKKVANWVINDLRGLLNKYKIDIKDCPISPTDFAFLVLAVEEGLITRAIGRRILYKAFERNKSYVRDI
jgi:aspartyl-tRNA(Asn)/glutamyl-tRNA(Gln) amidotransferase subunit B